jgi:hypothetical protein
MQNDPVSDAFGGEKFLVTLFIHGDASCLLSNLASVPAEGTRLTLQQTLPIRSIGMDDDTYRHFTGKPEEQGADNRNDQTAKQRRPETIDAKLHPQTAGNRGGQ